MKTPRTRARGRKAAKPLESTAQAEAQKRIEADQPAPTAEVVQAAAPGDAQTLADTAMIMGPNSDTTEAKDDKAPSREEFREDRKHQLDPASVHGVTGRSIHDVQAEQNAQVAELTTDNPPAEIRKQRREAAGRIKEHASNHEMRNSSRPIDMNRSLSLHEMGVAKTQARAV